MADCFDDIDPSSCQGLGTLLKNLTVSGGDGGGGVSGVSGVPNACIDFDVGDWSIYDDCSYELTISAATHNQGTCPMAEIQRSVSGIYAVVGVEKIWSIDGSLSLRIPRRPDLRFAGRAVIDG